MAFFEHERAASAFDGAPLAVLEWETLRALHLGMRDERTRHPSRAAPAASSASSAAARHACFCFELELTGGRLLTIRTDSPTQRALWAREILRVATWRAVHALQLDLASEWHDVMVTALGRAELAPPLCSSPPRAAGL